MKISEKNQKLILISAVIILIIAIILIVIFYKPATNNKIGALPSSNLENEQYNSPTKDEVSNDAKVYEKGDSTPENVAAPVNVSEYGLIKLRSFTMNAEKNNFTPKTFTCNQGEIIDIEITAVDKDYDIIQPDNGLSLTIKKGETKSLQSQMSDVGKFAFYCPSCGGLNSSAVGYIIVIPPQIKYQSETIPSSNNE